MNLTFTKPEKVEGGQYAATALLNGRAAGAVMAPRKYIDSRIAHALADGPEAWAMWARSVGYTIER